MSHQVTGWACVSREEGPVHGDDQLSNHDALEDLRQLRAAYSEGRAPIEHVADGLERLTYLLVDVGPGEDRALRGLVNELERIRFGRLPEHQAAAVDVVLGRAERIFEGVASVTGPSGSGNVRNVPIRLFDVVRLPAGLPDHGLPPGTRAVVVDIHHEPYDAFEIEVVGDGGETLFVGAVDTGCVERVEGDVS